MVGVIQCPSNEAHEFDMPLLDTTEFPKSSLTGRKVQYFHALFLETLKQEISRHSYNTKPTMEYINKALAR